MPHRRRPPVSRAARSAAAPFRETTRRILVAALVAWTAGAGSVPAAEPTTSTAARAAYAAAAALHNREAWDLAAEEWEAFLAAHPRDALAPRARCYLGVCQKKTDRWPTAIETFRAVIAAGADPEAVALARWELAQGTFIAAQTTGVPEDYRAAIERLREMITTTPQHPQAAAATHLLGEALWQAGLRDDAISTWRRFVADHDRSPLLPEVLYALGVGAAETGDPSTAAHTLARFAADFPNHRLAPDVALWRADLASEDGDLEAAESILTALAAAPARAAEALDRLGRVRERRGDRAGAVAAYTTLARDHGTTPLAAAARVAAGRVLLEDGQPDAARQPLETALADGGVAAVTAAHLLCHIALDRGEVDRALEIVAGGLSAAEALPDRAVLEPEAVPVLQLDRADALRRVPARREECVAACDALQAAHPDSPLAASAATIAALTLLDLGRPDAALDRADGVLAAFGARADTADAVVRASLVRVEALVALDRSADAAAALERILAESPEGPQATAAWYRLGQLRRAEADHEAAYAAFVRCHETAPQGPRAAAALLAAAQSQAALERLPDALVTWTAVIDSFPRDPAARSARLARAEALRRRGNATAALADARAVLEEPLSADDAAQAAARVDARLIEGLCLVATGDDAAAAETFAALLRDTPDAPVADRALHELGFAHERRGATADALRAYTTLVERFPGSPWAASSWLAIGELRWDAADHAAAAAAYTSALDAAADPSGPIAERALHKLGWTHALRGDQTAAAEAFTRQLAAAPDGPLAADGRAMLGQSLLASDRVADARTVLAAALADPAAFSSPEMRASAFVRAAEAAARDEAWQESLDLSSRFLAAEPGSPQAPQARYAAAWALQHLGRLDEARGRFAAIADGPPTDLAARARLMEGEVLFEQGDHRAAIKAFFKVAYGFGGADAPTAFHPWQAQATFEAARCFEVLGQREQARGLYGELIERYPEAEQVPAARRRLAALTDAVADPSPRDGQVLAPRPSPDAEKR